MTGIGGPGWPLGIVESPAPGETVARDWADNAWFRPPHLGADLYLEPRE